MEITQPSEGFQDYGDKVKHKEWIPVTMFGLLVKDIKIMSHKEICLLSLPIGESKIINIFHGCILTEWVTRDYAFAEADSSWPTGPLQVFFLTTRDYNDHVGLAVKCSKVVVTAIWGAIIFTKLSILLVKRSYWGNKIGKQHSVLCKVTGRFDSVLVQLIAVGNYTDNRL